MFKQAEHSIIGKGFTMRVSAAAALFAATLATAACGTNQEQRAATGGLTGAAIGALAGGPVGALIGVAVGAGAGAVTPIGADEVALWGRDQLAQVADSTPVVRDIARDDPPRGRVTEGSGSSAPAADAQSRTSGSSDDPAGSRGTSLPVSGDAARQLQSALKAEGLYDGAIDGIIGPSTQRALAAYQQRHGLGDTAALQWATLQRLASSPDEKAASSDGSGPGR